MKFRLAALMLAAAFAPVAHAQGDPAKAQQIVKQVCSACHGSDGNSTVATNPSLAGQHAAYIAKELSNFKAKPGSQPERVNPVMNGMAAPLSDDDIKNLAAYFSGQKPAPRAAHDAELVKLGRSIYRAGIAEKGVPACAGCHSPDGAGIPAQFPRLAGQHPEYIAAQLKAFRVGERANDANSMMRMTASRLSDKEIAAVAEYVAGLR